MEQTKSPAKPGGFRSKPQFLLEVYDITQKTRSSPLKDPLAKKRNLKETGKGQRTCLTILQAAQTNVEADSVNKLEEQSL